MIDTYMVVASFLLFNVMAGMIRVLRGPTPGDRMLAAQLFGTTGVATMIVLAKSMEMPALLDVALLFALLAAVTLVAFVVRLWASASSGN
jgi:multicomponent Na+:H+ antiporter subunit F